MQTNLILKFPTYRIFSRRQTVARHNLGWVVEPSAETLFVTSINICDGSSEHINRERGRRLHPDRGIATESCHEGWHGEYGQKSAG